jgi:hypothetical protein
MKEYQFVKDSPVAKFFYKGDHTHPVRRVILIVDQDDERITGYELREGSVTRSFKDAPIKSYRRDRIARIGQIDRRRVLRRNVEDKRTLNKSTLVRTSLRELVRQWL